MTRRLPLVRRYPTTPITPRAIFGPPFVANGDWTIQYRISANFVADEIDERTEFIRAQVQPFGDLAAQVANIARTQGKAAAHAFLHTTRGASQRSTQETKPNVSR